jgi:peptidoglycan/xylan/chitin deacetylase (PgdA/CDA1 family)
MTHVASPNASEIVGARDWLNKTAGIPKEKVVGFRAPYLMFDPQQREILQENGFSFDSSISEQYPTATSPSAGQRLWPYTMDYGLPQNCAIR